MKKTLILITLASLLLPYQSIHAAFADNFSGRFVLNNQKDQSVWYVNPNDKRKYPLNKAGDLWFLSKLVGANIAENDFQKIAQANMPVAGDKVVAAKYAGKILRRENNELWYVNPKDLRRYWLGTEIETMEAIKKNADKLNYYDFLRLHKPGSSESINQYSSYEQKKITLVDGRNFSADIVSISLDNPKLKIYTDTADAKDCAGPCKAKSVADFVLAHKGFAGINGSYFNTGAAKLHYNFFPVYNTTAKFLTNRSQLKYWTTGPVIAFDTDNNFYYYPDSRDFAKAVEFDTKGVATIKQSFKKIAMQAAIGNKPKLIADGNNQLIEWDLDDYQKKHKSTWNALAYKKIEGSKGKLMIVAVKNSTLPEMAEVLQSMQVDFALNIDGGTSTGMVYNDEYMLGPGRNVPNAIVFAEE